MKARDLLKIFLLISILYFPIFGHLGSIPIRQYDESRLAQNAYEMSNDNDFIVTHFDGQPDMWNTKPPLMIWFHLLFIKIFGFNETSIRLSSAFAALITCLFLVYFAKKFFGNFLLGAIASVILISSIGYMNVHAARTGDYDSLLTLFTTIYSLCFFLFIENDEKKYLIYTFIAITLATLTKGVAGLMFIPSLFVYALIRRKFVRTLLAKEFYFGLGAFIVLVLGYYLLREHYNPGYLKAVWDNELMGRYFITNEGHEEGFWFYYQMLVRYHFVYWFWFVPAGLLIGIFYKNSLHGKLALFTSISVILYFLVISVSKTKLEWYNVPLYPFLAIIVAISITAIYQALNESTLNVKVLKVNLLPIIFLFVVFITPYAEIIGRTKSARVFPWEEEFYRVNYYLKDAIKGKHDLNGFILLHDNYGAHNQFYINILRDKGVDIKYTYDWKNLNPNDKVIAHQQVVKDYINANFKVEILDSYYNIFFYKILGPIANK